ncbi:FAR8 Factor arrest protein 8 [Candida maltosa Xu316]|uniref:Striatin N-terminal domain-containing protein n=1 Tax=Candida maltosa (strain Xu316) TaxID=1245528 RepID=M3JAX0_CANMX|nr:hypothetical protein G210_0007 [Candida maltosa Xu316]
MNSQQQQQNQQNQQQQQFQQQYEVTYTLPGVINYLTSEFTNLERFKIMTNLEKNEMKYKIIELQSELNNLKYINEKQSLKINQLEEENQKLKTKLNLQESDVKKEEEKEEDLKDLNDVDLQMIKKSRQQLTNSMREIVTLLKAPTSINNNYSSILSKSKNDFDALLNSPEINHNPDEFDNNNDDEDEDDDHNHVKHSKKHSTNINNSSSIIQQYFSNDRSIEEFPKNNDEEYDDDLKPSASESFDLDDVLERAITNSSDNTTVVLDDLEDDSNTTAREKLDEDTFDCDEVDTNNLYTKKTSKSSPEPNPDPSINDYADSSYNQLDVFNHDQNTIYLNSMNDDDEDAKKVKMYMISSNKLIATQEFEMASSPKKILSLFPIDLPNSILIIEKDGDIKLLKFLKSPLSVQEYLLTSVQAHFQDIESCGLINFSAKPTTNDGMIYFGLCISGQAVSNQQFLSKVYQLSYDLKTSNITSKEIGSYNKKYITKGKTANNVQFAGWFNNSDKPEDSNSPKPTKSATTEPSLSSYEILYKVDGKTIKLNIVSKQSSYVSSG